MTNLLPAEKTRSDVAGIPVWLLCMAVVVLCGVTFLRMPHPLWYLKDPDVGIQVAGAQQIALLGEHPFADWRSTYGPIRFYLSYLARLVLGERAGAEYALCCLGITAAYTAMLAAAWRLVFGAGRRGSRTGLVCLALAAFVIVAFAVAMMPRYMKFYIVLGPAAAVAAGLAYLATPTTVRLAAMAASVVLAASYRLDVGGWALATCAAAALLADGTDPAAARADLRVRVRRLLTLLCIAGGLASPWLVFLAWRGALGAYLIDSTYYGIGLAKGLSLPFPSFRADQPWTGVTNLTAAGFVGCYASAALLALWLATRWSEMTPLRRRQALIVLPVLVGALGQTLHRSDYSHLVQGITGVYLLWALAVGVWADGVRSRSASASGFGLVPLLVTTLAMSASFSVGWQNTYMPRPAWSNVEVWRGVYWNRLPEFIEAAHARWPEAAQVKLARSLRTAIAPSERFFAMPYLTNLYGVTGRPFASAQMHLAPGYFNDLDGQQRQIATLERQGLPPVVEQVGGNYDGLEHRTTRAMAPALMAFLRERYEVDTKSGLPKDVILWRAKAMLPRAELP